MELTRIHPVKAQGLRGWAAGQLLKTSDARRNVHGDGPAAKEHLHRNAFYRNSSDVSFPKTTAADPPFLTGFPKVAPRVLAQTLIPSHMFFPPPLCTYLSYNCSAEIQDPRDWTGGLCSPGY